jgi:hypothetical protein
MRRLRIRAFLLRSLRALAALWDATEALFRRAERRTRAIEAEVRQLGLDLLDQVDDLPFVPTLVQLPPITNQFYAHGAFMGAAPALLDDRRWRRILAFLMPDVFLEVRTSLEARRPTGHIIPMFENNPVMCAFGAWHGFRRRSLLSDLHPNDLAGVEWDVYVDGELIVAFETAASEQARHDAIGRLADTMVIAHASTADSVQEAAGVCQYEDVRRTPKTMLGGVEAPAWLDLFGRALELASAEDLEDAIARMSSEARRTAGEACVLHTFVTPRSVDEALVPWCAISGRRWFSIVLEIKSRQSSPALLRALVEELNRRGLHVAAVCSFDRNEVRGVGAKAQRVRGTLLDGPIEVRFFHWAGDVQSACDGDTVDTGEHILFNGASLLHPSQDATRPYRWSDEEITHLDEYRRERGLRLGVYVQEGDCDAAAAHALWGLVARYPATFELGFAWGGLLDVAHIPHDGTDRRGFGAQAMLRYAGSRPWRLPASGG